MIRLQNARLSAFVVLLVALLGCSKKGLPAPTGGGSVPPSKSNLRRPVELTQALLDMIGG